MYERPPLDLKCTIKVRNLCKTFATETAYEISLDNISVDIFEVSEILALFLIFLNQIDAHGLLAYYNL